VIINSSSPRETVSCLFLTVSEHLTSGLVEQPFENYLLEALKPEGEQNDCALS